MLTFCIMIKKLAREAIIMKGKISFLIAILMLLSCMTSYVFADADKWDFSDDAESSWVTSIGKNGVVAAKEASDSNKYLYLSGNNYTYYEEDLIYPYVFEADFKDERKAGWVGCFVRTSVEAGTIKLHLNEKDRTLPWTENDHSARGKDEALTNAMVSASLVGSAGIGIRLLPKQNKITLFVKTYDLTRFRSINNITYDIPTNKDISAEFIKVTFEDNNKGLLKVKFDGTLVASVEYEDLGSYSDELYLEGSYYKTAKIKDAEGNVIASTDSAIIYEDSTVLLYTRGGDLQVDNILIDESASDAPADPTTKPADPTTKPADPTTKPADPTTKPADPTTKPADPTTKPADPTTKPADPSDKVILDLSQIGTSGTFTAAGYPEDQLLLNYNSGGANSARIHSLGTIDLSKISKFIIHYGNDSSAKNKIGVLKLTTTSGEVIAQETLAGADGWKQTTTVVFDVSGFDTKQELILGFDEGALMNGIVITEIELTPSNSNTGDFGLIALAFTAISAIVIKRKKNY